MVIFIFVLLFFAFLTSPSYAGEPIKIGVTLGLTGKYSEMSDMQMKGFRLWEGDVNKRGGILGRKVEIIILDDKSDRDTARSLYEHLILKDKVDLLFAPYSSELTEAILPVIERYRYPALATGASADRLWEKGYKYVFGVYLPASKYAVSFLKILVVHDFKDIAIIHADDAFSISIADGTKRWAERFRLNISLIEGFKKGTADLTGIAQKVRDSNAEVLIVCGHFDEAVNMRLSLKKIGWLPRVYYASVGPALEEFYKRLKEGANHVFFSSQWEPVAKFPGSEEFYKEFTRTYKTPPSYHAASAYAGGQILETAIKRAGGIDREKVREMLSTMDTITIIGRYGVDKRGMQVRHINLIIQWQDGRKEVVYPEELRTAKPIFK